MLTSCTNPFGEKPKTITLSNESLGISFATKRVTSKGLTLVCNQKNGLPTGELLTGREFWLEKNQDDQWIKLASSWERLCWTEEAWTIPKNHSVEWKVNWEGLYGELPLGNYRIGKEVIDFRSSGNFDRYTYYVTFEIS